MNKRVLEVNHATMRYKKCICAKCTRSFTLTKPRETGLENRKRKRRQKNAGLWHEDGKKRGYIWRKLRKSVMETIPENRIFCIKQKPNKCLAMNRVSKMDEIKRKQKKT